MLANALEEDTNGRVVVSHTSQSEAPHRQNLRNEGASTGEGGPSVGESVLQSVFGILEMLRAGQDSLREEMSVHTASVAGGLESKEVATMERLTHLDIKLADVYEKQRQAALDMRTVIEGLDNIQRVLE